MTVTDVDVSPDVESGIDAEEKRSLARRAFEPITLADLKNEIATERSEATTEDMPLSEVEFHLGADEPHFKIRGDKIPASPSGVQAWGDYLGIPAPFHKRVGKELGVGKQGELLSWFLDISSASTASAVRISYSPLGVLSVQDPERRVINPEQIIDVAIKVLGTHEAEVVRSINTPADFAFDVHVPMNYDHGIGGDIPGQRGIEIGDISAGGLTFHYDRKHNLAPETGSFVYRFDCTNGQRHRDDSLKLDTRGNTVEEVLAELEAMAQRAFRRTERQMKHFYGLRKVIVTNPERELVAIAREHRIPDRSLVMLTKLAASNLLPDKPSRFDLVNLITNFANDPAVTNDGGRLLLEAAGGAVVQDEAARCGHCRSVVLA